MEDVGKKTDKENIQTNIQDIKKNISANQISLDNRVIKKSFSYKKIVLLIIIFISLITVISLTTLIYLSRFNKPKMGIVKERQNIQSLSSPTIESTANWKTYTNTKVGFELKYPERYPTPKLITGDNPTIYAIDNEDNTDISFGINSQDSIDLIVFPFNGTIDELKNYPKLPIILPSHENTSLIKTNLVGEKTAKWYKATPKIVYKDDQNNGSIRVYFIGNNHGFILYTTLDHNEAEIDQFLSAFKFIDQTPTPSISSTQMANPASTYCVEQGGQSKIITASDGSQSRLCIFSDGRQCDEWNFYRTKVCK